jgi:hypothetical protein
MRVRAKQIVLWFVGGLLMLVAIPFLLLFYRRSSVGESHMLAAADMIWTCPLRNEFDGTMKYPEFSDVRLAFVADPRLHFTIDADGLCAHLLATKKPSVQVKFDVTHKRFLGTTYIQPTLIDGISDPKGHSEGHWRWGYTRFACPEAPCTNVETLLHE